MNRAILRWSVVMVWGLGCILGCGPGDDPQVPSTSDNRVTSRASGTITSLGGAQNLSLSNSYAVAVQDPAAFSDQWTLYVIFGRRSFDPLAVPQGVLAFFLDQVDPHTPVSIEVPSGRAQAALHTDFDPSLPVGQQTTAPRTVMNVTTGGFFIIEQDRSAAPASAEGAALQVRLHDFALSTGTGVGVLMQAEIPYRLTRVPTNSFLTYVRQLGVDHLPTTPSDGGGVFPPPPPGGGGSGGGSSGGGGSWPPPPPL